MILIEEELERVNLLNEKVGSEFLTSQKYRVHREWWILGSFVKLLKECNVEFPIYAVPTNPPDPDFMTYDNHQREYKPIEIAEVLTPDRKRTQEYEESENSVIPVLREIGEVENPWSTFKNILNKKYLKYYQQNCWLVIYHNMWYGEITSLGFWHKTILANVKYWRESKIVNVEKSPYENIFVINSDGKSLVRIYPSLNVMVTEK